MSQIMSSNNSPFVAPKVGYHRWLQITRKAEHVRRKKLGLNKLKAVLHLRSNQHDELPKLPFPFLVNGHAVFTFTPKYNSGYADRFRRKIIVNRIVR